MASDNSKRRDGLGGGRKDKRPRVTKEITHRTDIKHISYWSNYAHLGHLKHNSSRLSFVLIVLRNCNFLISPLNTGACRTSSCAHWCSRFQDAAVVLIVTTCLCGCRSLLVFTSGTSNLFAIGRVETVGQTIRAGEFIQNAAYSVIFEISLFTYSRLRLHNVIRDFGQRFANKEEDLILSSSTKSPHLDPLNMLGA